MTGSRELAAQIESVLEEAEEAFSRETAQEYEQFKLRVATLKDMARERAQRKLKDEYREIVSKLENGDRLMGSERKLVKMLICGEADSYVNTEEDVDHWREDLETTVDRIDSLSRNELEDPEKLMQLQAYCKDAMKVLPDITNFLRDRERVERFEQTIEGDVDEESGRILAEVLRDKMTSEYR